MMYKAIDRVQNMKPEEYARKVLFGASSEFWFSLENGCLWLPLISLWLSLQTETVLNYKFQFDELC